MLGGPDHLVLALDELKQDSAEDRVPSSWYLKSPATVLNSWLCTYALSLSWSKVLAPSTACSITCRMA